MIMSWKGNLLSKQLETDSLMDARIRNLNECPKRSLIVEWNYDN